MSPATLRLHLYLYLGTIGCGALGIVLAWIVAMGAGLA